MYAVWLPVSGSQTLKSKSKLENIMEALALLFGLFLVVLLGLLALAAVLAALQGITLAIEADKTVAVLSVVLIFPAVIFGVVYWLTGTNLPGKFMDDLREKQRKDSAEPRKPAPEEHSSEIEVPIGKAGGDNHDNVDHRLVEPAADKK